MSNPWIQFLSEHKGQGLSMQDLKEKYHTKKPIKHVNKDILEEKKQTLTDLFTAKNEESKKLGERYVLKTSLGPRKDIIFEQVKVRQPGVTIEITNKKNESIYINSFQNKLWANDVAKFLHANINSSERKKTNTFSSVEINDTYKVSKKGSATPGAVTKFKKDVEKEAQKQSTLETQF